MFNFFKKKEPEVKIVEKEVPVYVKSKFAFAHNDIPVRKYKFVRSEAETIPYANLGGADTFECGYIISKTGHRMYPIFRMPDTLPKTRLVSKNKIKCVGTISVNDVNDIVDVSLKFSNNTLADIVNSTELNCPDEESLVTKLDIDSNIQFDNIKGAIDLDTFKNSVVFIELLTNMLP